VFIDYPGFNMHTAKRIKKRWPDIPIIYYVSPQLWAYWHWRIYTIRRCIDLMLVLFPFEVDVYEKGGRWALVGNDMDRIRIEEREFRRPSKLQVRYVGHPVIGKINEFRPDPDFRASLRLGLGDRVVALLPGSRDNEINTMLPVMLECAQRLRTQFPGLRFVISIARPGLQPLIEKCCRDAAITDFDEAYRIVPTHMYDIVDIAEIALVTSGTAAFEAALMLKPIIVMYRFNWISYLVARVLFRVPFINLANIVGMRRIVPEFIQHRMTPERIVPAAAAYLTDKAHYQRTVKELQSVRDQLGHGDASERAAEEICRYMRWGSNDRTAL
jgi:lipid-A-disaccharide synthase